MNLINHGSSLSYSLTNIIMVSIYRLSVDGFGVRMRRGFPVGRR